MCTLRQPTCYIVIVRSVTPFPCQSRPRALGVGRSLSAKTYNRRDGHSIPSLTVDSHSPSSCMLMDTVTGWVIANVLYRAIRGFVLILEAILNTVDILCPHVCKGTLLYIILYANSVPRQDLCREPEHRRPDHYAGEARGHLQVLFSHQCSDQATQSTTSTPSQQGTGQEMTQDTQGRLSELK